MAGSLYAVDTRGLVLALLIQKFRGTTSMHGSQTTPQPQPQPNSVMPNWPVRSRALAYKREMSSHHIRTAWDKGTYANGIFSAHTSVNVGETCTGHPSRVTLPLFLVSRTKRPCCFHRQGGVGCTYPGPVMR